MTTSNTPPVLAINGAPKTVTATPLPRKRWGAAELERLATMVEQPSLFYWNGPQCAALLEEFRKTYPLRWCMPCSSGTAAIHIAVAALRLPPGSEIITTPITDMGSVIGPLYQQCVPVFADIDPHTYNLDPADVEKRITPKTRAIVVVHLAGNPANMDALLAIARAHDLFVIEDCAQAWGAAYRGRPVGLFGHLACYSFNEYKHVSCGDGGLVGTNDERFGPSLCKWGDKHYDRALGGRNPETLSPNYRMCEPQAAVAAAQLTKLPGIVEKHQRLGELLQRRLREMSSPGVILPHSDPRDTNSHWFCLLRLSRESLRCSRDEFVAALVAEGAQASAGYIPRTVYRYPLFQNHDFFGGRWPLREAGLTTMDYRAVRCPVAEALLEDGVSLPINPGLTEEYIEQTAGAIDKVARYYAR